nr:MFS transporter [uncultured Devosia sp.]
MSATETARPTEGSTPWGIVVCMSLTMFVLIASEFMPVALLTPIAGELGITEGQAGQAIAFSGFFAVITALFGPSLLRRLDRRSVMLGYTVVLVLSGITVALAPNYLVFMAGRALIGIAIGGYISLTTAILARIVLGRDLPKALSMLQGGSALASVLAQPLGSLLGGVVSWRGAFFVVVPLGIIAFVWQAIALPRVPPTAAVAIRNIFGLLRDKVFATGMVAMIAFFTGQFALSTYLRPFLEFVTRLDIGSLSAYLLAIGLAGLFGTTVISVFLRKHLTAVLIGFPAILVIVALALVGLGSHAVATAILLIVWGLFTTPVPVAWNTWMTRVIPDRLEAGGSLFVALIQFAITFGAFMGGILYDHAGWWSAFVFGAAAFAMSAMVGVLVTRDTYSGQTA